MGRPAGSPNRMTAEKDAAQKSLIKKYGLSPLESIPQKRSVYQKMWDDQMSRPSRRRNIHKIREAEAAILKYDSEALPYYRAEISGHRRAKRGQAGPDGDSRSRTHKR